MAISPTTPPSGKGPSDGDGQRRATRKPTVKGAVKAGAKATGARKHAARKPAAPRKIAAKPTGAKPRATAAKSRTDQVRETVTERIVKPARAAAETAAETARGAAQSAREAVSSAASQGSSFGLKMIEHAEANAREAFNAMRAAAKSRDVSEVLKVQGEYLREQGSRSLGQAREVGEMIAQFGRDAIAPLTGRKK